MDPMFHTYNGVPQESKLATYMKRQSDGPALSNSLSKNLSNLSLNDALPILKKTVSGANEFIPRSSPALHNYSNSTSPLTVTAGLQNKSPTPTVPTYQEYVGGTTYFYSAATQESVQSEEEPHGNPSVTLFPGTPSHAKTAMAHFAPVSEPSYYISNQLRMEIQHKNNLTLLQPDPAIFPDLPVEVDNYHELVPLEPLPPQHKAHLILPYQTSTYKATHIKTGLRYCLRRIHGFRLPNSKCMVLVDMWKKLSHSNIVQLREVFTTKAFGDQSMVFVYDYLPDSETIMSRYFSSPESVNGYTDSFSSNPNAPRPYSHSKNSLLRQQHTSGMLAETTLWSYVIQLTGAVAVVHAANLACRIIDPTKILLTGRQRLRLSSTGILDLLTFDTSSSNPLAVIPHYQQEDMTSLGKVILALACRSLIAVQRDNLQTSLDLMSRSYSADLRNVVLYLLTTKQVRTVVDLMPMIGARYYSQLDTVQYHNDILHSELAKEMENGRLCRLLVKLGTINERPELNMDPSWSETGDRYMLKLFRDHMFHQVTEDGRPFLDMAHVIHCLNKLDAGTHEKVCLMSRDEQSVLVVTYAELKACLEQSFAEILLNMSSSPRSGATPRRPTTPRSRSDAEFIVEPSDPYSLPISTPGGPNLPPTSPIRLSGEGLSSPLNYGTPSSVFSTLRTPRSMSRNTPLRGRADLIIDKRIRQVNVQSEADRIVSSSEADQNEPTLVIWGTDVDVTRCKSKFKNFVENFVGTASDDPNTLPEQFEKIYLKELDVISEIEMPFFNLNCAHLEQFEPDLYRQLVNYPQEVIPSFDMAVNDVFRARHPDSNLPHQIQVRPFNAEKTQNMRGLNPEDIDKLITISGMVIRTSNIIPEMREAFFTCSVCNASRSVELDRGRIAEPTLCTNCNTNYCFNLIHNRSTFTDKQMVKLQESPDDMPAGQTPHTVTLFAHNDLVDGVTPGQRVSVTGIYRAVPYQLNPRNRNLKSVYRTHIDVLHYHKDSSKALHETDSEYDRFTPSPEKLEVIKALSQRPDLYERLAHAIAPSIYENEDIKKGILLQLFGGTRKTFQRSGRTSFRSELNVLLCGDPGTSKSQLLSYVYNLVPKSQYTSGKGSSAVGLTAYVTKDPESRQLVLQTGALVLADNGVCCIDEFDKMNEATRSVLHEVMEQQTLSIAKAGIICQLNARTSILAAANPVESEWNKNKTIIENIKLPHTLLSRFDLIFLVLDPQSEHYDRKLARHLVSLYYHSKEKDDEELMDRCVLRDYITYARDNIQPTLSELAGEHLVHAYVEMRRVGSGKGLISAYPRQLESLIRLSEAHAKMRLSPVVELVDVQEAQRLHREALKQSATDPLSGKIDVNILTTGLSMAARKKKQEVVEALRALITKKGYVSTLPYQKVFKELKESVQMVIPRDMFDEALKDMQEEGVLKVTARQSIKLL